MTRRAAFAGRPHSISSATPARLRTSTRANRVFSTFWSDEVDSTCGRSCSHFDAHRRPWLMSLVSSLQARGSGRIVPTARRNGELKIVLADDHPIVRQGLLALLAANPSIVVAAGCANGREALGAIREHRPNIAILDVRMPEMSGVKVLCEVMREHLPTRIILLTATI